MIGLIILTILIMVENKCEYCNRKPYYKISSFHSGYLVLPGQKNYKPIPGNVEMEITHICGHCVDNKESYVNDYCYVFVEKI